MRVMLEHPEDFLKQLASAQDALESIKYQQTKHNYAIIEKALEKLYVLQGHLKIIPQPLPWEDMKESQDVKT